MQIKDKYFKPKSILWFLIKSATVLMAIMFIYRRVQEDGIEVESIVWPESSLFVLSIVLLLMLLNWTLEALRWKLSLSVFEKVTLVESLQIVVSGLALNWVVPFTAGDAAYRLAWQKDKYSTTSAMFINRGFMILITTAYGLLSIHYYSKLELQANVMLISFLLVALLGAWGLHRYGQRFLGYFKQISGGTLLSIISISLLRYVVFVLQFYLLMSLFLPLAPSVQLLYGIGWIFFFKSAIPSMLGGLGVREASALVFFAETAQPELVLIPVFLIWVINTVIPSIAGLMMIWSRRFVPNSSFGLKLPQ